MRPQARKRLGQHFLHDPGVIARIVAAIDPQPDDRLVEIGGGEGALTLPLLDRTGRIDVVEVDQRLASTLGEHAGVTVHAGDALEFDFGSLAGSGRLRVAGNLPYNISTPLLFHLLDFAPRIDDMHLMLQKEVVTRMCAAPGGRDYGRLTVMLSRWLEIERLFDVGPGAFRPPPRVRSSVVRIRVLREPRFDVVDADAFSNLVAACFSMRRKTLGRILRNRLDTADIEAAGIDPRARPETLRPEQFALLADMTLGH